MKPYRGTLLGAAMLLAALPLSGCGDSDNWKTSGDVTLKTSTASVQVKDKAIFTVESKPPGPDYTCDTDIEYQAQGAGLNVSWADVPGIDTTRVFELRPTQTNNQGTTLSVMARARCLESREDWKYSNQVDVTVTDPTTQPTVTLTANPPSVARNNPVTFTLGATTPAGCNLGLSYEYSGAGFAGVTVVNPAHVGQFVLTPPASGTLVVTAKGWCTQNPSDVVLTTVSVTVTAAALPRVTSIILSAAPNPYVISGTSVNFNFTATRDAGCTAEFSYENSGGGIAANTVNLPPGIQVFTLNPIAGTLTVIVRGKCAENITEITSDTVDVAQ